MSVRHAALLVLVACSSSATPAADAGADANAADTKADAVAPPPSPLVEALAGKRVLWVGAHPDDESTVSPLLAEACRERSAKCTFLVATRGEAGKCNAPVVCGADLGAYREGEMKNAAALYGGTLIELGLPDGSAAHSNEVAAAWAALRGGNDALVEFFRAAIASAAPDYLVTFDPRHGTSCHPDHRAASALAVLASKKMGTAAPTVWLAEVTMDIAPGETSIGYVQSVPTDAKVQAYDATRFLPTFGDTAWAFLLSNLRAHKSQFVDSRIAGFAAAPAAEQKVFVLPLTDVVDPDPRYVLCP